MSRRRKRTPEYSPKAAFFSDLSPHTKQAIGAVFFVVLAVFFILSSLGIAGVAGEFTHTTLTYLFGYGFALAPIACFLFVYVFLKPRDDNHISGSKLVGVALTFFALLGLLALYDPTTGGLFGRGVFAPLHMLVGDVVAGIVLCAFVLIGIFLTFNTSFLHLFFARKSKDTLDELPEVDTTIDVPPLTPEEIAQSSGDQETPIESVSEEQKPTIRERIGLSKRSPAEFVVSNFTGQYAPPPLNLLNKDRGKPDSGDIQASKNIIKRTLKKFNIDVEIDSVVQGPTVTQYAIKPAEGVKLEKIVGLQTNLEYALAASPIRIEAPIPGKSLVGIEVPNKIRQTIGLASLFTFPEYTDSKKPLLTVLGKDITNKAEFADIARMPHGLIAGTTGSGKSVVIHNIIISLLFRNSPEQLRFFMVDPKLIELTLYNGIPHLLSPVITDVKKVILALKWAIKEMERRLEVLQEHKVQNITSYHDKIYQPAKKKFEEDGSPEEGRAELPEPLPYIVIIIDELADLMSLYPKELEACIVRLAQKSRAVGIHLIVATQRPEVKVITGLIKANMPTRIALKVNSLIDSRTILDQTGAEKLSGLGDMLFLSPESSKPKRLQSAFVSGEEVKKVVSYLKNQDAAQSLDTIDLEGEANRSGVSIFDGMSDDEDGDELYEEARLAVIEGRKASTSYLQRKLKIGYSRAARLIDMLEERGVVGPGEGSKPRAILEGARPVDENEERAF